jgi:hypothetical protein
LQRDDGIRLVVVVEEDIPFADHRASGLTFGLPDGNEMWISDGERFGPLDTLACVLLEQIWPDLVRQALDVLTAWWSRERCARAKRVIVDHELEALFARAAVKARRQLAS